MTSNESEPTPEQKPEPAVESATELPDVSEMPNSDAAAADSGDSQSMAIDFSQYRRPELGERISQLLSVTGAVGTTIKWLFIALILWWLPLPYFFMADVPWLYLLLALVWGGVAAVLFGLPLGLAMVINRTLDHLVQILDMSLLISDTVARDCEGVSGGSKRMPTARELVYGVYDNVLLPTLEGVVRGKSRLLGGILFRAYRFTLDRMVKRLLRGGKNNASRRSTSL